MTAGGQRHVVVLYNPRAVFYTLPLGLLAIASQLDPARFEVRIIDGRLERDPVAAVLDALDGALCLGVGVLTGSPISDALAVSRAAKACRPALPVIWGGWHPSLFPLETLAEPAVDITVQGQGEVTFRELIERLAAGAGPAGVAGLCYRSPAGLEREPARLLTDVNVLASHDYDLLPVEAYFAGKGARQLDYVSSAGCYYRCAFCADPQVYGRRWSGLAPARAGAEIEALWRRYRFDDLAFQDEALFTDASRVVDIAEELLRRGVRCTWTGTLRADQGAHLPADALATCVRAGLRQVMIGVESGAQSMLDRMTKDVTVAQVEAATRAALDAGLSVIAPFIVGFPGESDAELWASLGLIKRLRALSPRVETPVFYFQPYPGSRVAEELALQGGRLPATLEEWANFDFIAGTGGAGLSAARRRLVERFKFYNRFAGGPESWPRRPLQWLARWRCRHDWYGLPLEQALVERLWPTRRLS